MNIRTFTFLTSLFAVLASLFLLVLTSPIQAVGESSTWTGAGGDNKFSTATNWEGNSIPVSGNKLIFPANISADKTRALTNDLPVDFEISGIDIIGSTPQGVNEYFTLSGNQINLNGDINANFSRVAISFNKTTLMKDITIGGGYYVYLTGDIDLNSHNLICVTDVNQISGNIKGNGNIIANSALYLNGTNTFSGDVIGNGPASTIFSELYTDNSFGNSQNTIKLDGGNLRIGIIYNSQNNTASRTLAQNITILNPTITDNIGNLATKASIYSYEAGYGLPAGVKGELILSGDVTLNNNLEFSPYPDIKLTGNIIYNNKSITVKDGVSGKLIIGDTSINSKELETVINDKNVNLSIYIVTNNVYIIESNGERGNVNLSGGKLKGTGVVGVIYQTNGTVAPGLSPGTLNSGNYSTSGGEFEAEIGGTNPGEYDQLNVTGTVVLGTETTLKTVHWNGYKPALNNQFVIINNDASDAVTGNFKDLPQGSTFAVDGYTYTVSYTGGDGNDVVLTATGVPADQVAATPNTGAIQKVAQPLIATLLSIIAVSFVVFAVKANKENE